MATERGLPPDFADALDRVPEARDRFAALPPDRQAQWVDWIDRARGRRRAARIDEAIRRLVPSAVSSEEEVAEPLGPPPERYWWAWLLLLLLLVVAGLLIWFFLSRGGDKSTVPDVTGLPEQVAAQRIHQKGLIAIPNTAPSSRPLGIVFAQRPGAGVQLDKGQSVTIFISAGPAGKVVPDVTDLPEAKARQKLTAAGFKVQVKRVASTRPKGIATEQAPAAGVAAVKGTTVVLTVSSGRKPVVVPSVVGETQGAAVSQLTKLGLKPQLKNVPSSQPAGQVVAQKPPAGKEVDKGSAVTLNVSSGAGGATTTVQTTTAGGLTTIPSVRGLAITAGLRRLNTAGFRPLVRYVSSSQPAGRILSQSPAGGGAARTNTPIRVSVSTGPHPGAPETIPSIVGQRQGPGAMTVGQAGFRVLILFRQTTDRTENGRVVEQQPVAGLSIPRGLYVAIFVGHFSG